MPKGQYQRPKIRGPYKKENGAMVKRVVYLTNDQYEFLKIESAKRQMSYSELLRDILDDVRGSSTLVNTSLDFEY